MRMFHRPLFRPDQVGSEPTTAASHLAKRARVAARRLIEAGEAVKVANGVYRRVPQATFEEIASIGERAMQLHGLSRKEEEA